jgi:hypothetical protein
MYIDIPMQMATSEGWPADFLSMPGLLPALPIIIQSQRRDVIIERRRVPDVPDTSVCV